MWIYGILQVNESLLLKGSEDRYFDFAQYRRPKNSKSIIPQDFQWPI
jgi:hypothetical protein